MPSFANHVHDVICLRAEKQVIGIDASRIVASMQDSLVFSYRADKNGVKQPVSHDLSATHSDAYVSILIVWDVGQQPAISFLADDSFGFDEQANDLFCGEIWGSTFCDRLTHSCGAPYTVTHAWGRRERRPGKFIYMSNYITSGVKRNDLLIADMLCVNAAYKSPSVAKVTQTSRAAIS